MTVDFYQSTTVAWPTPTDTGEPAAALVAGARAGGRGSPAARRGATESMVVTLISYDRNTGLATFRTPDGFTRRAVVPPNLRSFAAEHGAGLARARHDDRGGRGHGRRRPSLSLARPGGDPPPARAGPRAGSPASGARRSRAAPARRVASVRGADAAVGAKREAGDRPAQPLRAAPAHRRHREQRHPGAGGRSISNRGGQRKQMSSPPISTTGLPGDTSPARSSPRGGGRSGRRGSRAPMKSGASTE